MILSLALTAAPRARGGGLTKAGEKTDDVFVAHLEHTHSREREREREASFKKGVKNSACAYAFVAA